MPQQLSALLGVLHLFTCCGMILLLCHLHMLLVVSFAMSSNPLLSESNVQRLGRIQIAVSAYRLWMTWRLPEIVFPAYYFERESEMETEITYTSQYSEIWRE